MKTKSLSLFALLSGITGSAFAQTPTPVTPLECTVRITGAAGMMNFWEGKYNAKVARILSRKGYSVVKDGPAVYELGFGGGTGFVCGTGLTWKDYLFAVDVSFTVRLSGPGTQIETHKSGQGFALGINARLKHRAFEAVRALPDCGEANPHYPKTKIEDAGQNQVRVTYPYLTKLSREAVGDAVYFADETAGQRICDHYELGEYVEGSKVTQSARAISTSNRAWQEIVYRVDPLGRLAEGYQYPSTRIVKSVLCEKKGN
jgi:hypothetical protein